MGACSQSFLSFKVIKSSSQTINKLLTRHLPSLHPLQPVQDPRQTPRAYIQRMRPDPPLIQEPLQHLKPLLAESSQLFVSLKMVRRRPRDILSNHDRAHYPVCLNNFPRLGNGFRVRVECRILAARATESAVADSDRVLTGDAVQSVAQAVVRARAYTGAAVRGAVVECLDGAVGFHQAEAPR